MSSAKSEIFMSLGTFLSRSGGFIRNLVIALVLGTTFLGNTYQSTNAVTNILFDLLAAGAFSAALIPYFNEVAHDNALLLKRARSLCGVTFFILGIISILGVLFSRQLSELIFQTSTYYNLDQQIELGSNLLKIIMPQLAIYGIGSVAIALLQVKRSFMLPAMSPLGNTIVTLICMLSFFFIYNSKDLNINIDQTLLLGFTATGGVVAAVAIPFIACWRKGFLLYPSLDWSSIKPVLKKAGWGIIPQAVTAVMLFIANYKANSIEGGVVAYQLAMVFFLAPYAIVANSIQTVMLTDISIKQNELRHKEIIDKTIKKMIEISTFLSFFVIALSLPAIKILLIGNASDGVTLTAVSLIVLTLSFVPFVLYQQLVKLSFVFHFTRQIAIYSAMACIAGVFLTLFSPYSSNQNIKIAQLSFYFVVLFWGLLMISFYISKNKINESIDSEIKLFVPVKLVLILLPITLAFLSTEIFIFSDYPVVPIMISIILLISIVLFKLEELKKWYKSAHY